MNNILETLKTPQEAENSSRDEDDGTTIFIMLLTIC